MYALLNSLLSDKTGGSTFTCFGISHLFYIALTVFVAVFAIIYLKNKSRDTRRRAERLFIGIAFGLYILDFFLMPFAYGEIDIEKLPFHICTAMCVMSFLANHSSFIGKFKLELATLGFVSNLVYLVYPAGVMWYGIHPLSYHVIQTLLFHSVMTVYGLLVLVYDSDSAHPKKCCHDLALTIIMTLWALLGSTLYSGSAGDYSYDHNWFFVKADPLGVIPEEISPIVMPFLNIVLFFAVSTLIHTIIWALRRLSSRSAAR